MWPNYRPTPRQREAIEAAFAGLERACESAGRSHVATVEAAMKAERRGTDGVPTIAAKALVVQWYAAGRRNPSFMARTLFGVRESAASLMILGAAHEATFTIREPVSRDLLKEAEDAHNAAFAAMMREPKP
jgi:hypothetical protein